MEKNIKIINFFLKDNKSGFKSKEKWLKKNELILWEDIIKFNKLDNDLTFKEKIWLYINSKKEVPKCECGKHLKFKKSLTLGYGEYCSIKCTNKSKKHIKSVKATNTKRYGGVAPIFNNAIKNKMERTNIEKYGVKNIFEDVNYIKEKTLKKLGVTHISKLDKTKDKIKKTNLKKYGVTTPLLKINNRVNNKKSKLKLFNKKYQELNIINDIGDIIIIKCEKCDEHYSIKRSVLFHRFKITDNPCTICYPIKSGSSIIEKELVEFINEMSIPFEENNRTILNGKELDIYIPSKKIAIEFNGLHWHSDKYIPNDYHLNKTELCNTFGINLIHIFEDEWVYKKDIVKSRLKNILGLTENKVYGRKCEVKEVDTKIKSVFLNENHIQGAVGSKINLGLYYNNELISIMTFGKRKILNNSDWELIRFCNKLDYTVIGGASKLFKKFFKSYDPDKIISFADRRWSSGNLYIKMNFLFKDVTSLNYYYVNNSLRENRIKYQKHKLIKMGHDENLTEKEITESMGLYRIYDCGNLKYEYINN